MFNQRDNSAQIFVVVEGPSTYIVVCPRLSAKMLQLALCVAFVAGRLHRLPLCVAFVVGRLHRLPLWDVFVVGRLHRLALWVALVVGLLHWLALWVVVVDSFLVLQAVIVDCQRSPRGVILR